MCTNLSQGNTGTTKRTLTFEKLSSCYDFNAISYFASALNKFATHSLPIQILIFLENYKFIFSLLSGADYTSQ